MVVGIDLNQENGEERLLFLVRLLYETIYLEHPGNCDGGCELRTNGSDDESSPDDESRPDDESKVDDRYLVKFREVDDDCYDLKETHDDLYKLFKSENTGKETIRLEQQVTFINLRGAHTDYENRGHYDCDKYYAFEPIQILGPGFYTLEELAITMYKMKSNKFDNWYELVSGAKDAGDMFSAEFTDVYQLIVDHGS